MTSKGHIVMSLAIAFIPFVAVKQYGELLKYMPYLFHSITFDWWTMAYFCGIIFGAILPDIDEPNSSIGRKTRIISDALKFSLGHRTLTHWFLTRIVVLMFVFILVDTITIRIFLFSMVIGMLVHDIGDHLTGGIKGYFWPIISATKNIRLASFQVGGIVENSLIIVMIMFVLIQLHVILNIG